MHESTSNYGRKAMLDDFRYQEVADGFVITDTDLFL